MVCTRLGWGSLSLAMLCAAGCATVHRKYDAQMVTGKAPLKVSSEIDGDSQSDYFKLINVTFENLTGSWLVVKNVEITPDKALENGDLRVVAGPEVAAWAQAMRRREDIKAENASRTRSLIAAAIIIPAAVTLGARDPGFVLEAETNVLLWNHLSSDVNQEHLKEHQLAAVPEGHLLSGPFLVPPGLQADRWLLINTKSARVDIENLRVKITLENGDESTFDLPLSSKAPLRSQTPQAKSTPR